ncbi:hypothetical protein [Oxalicibacterium faecigallinarum]|uniref:Uncharacterized protein n=1 Tax=Oxalicibacterium faecigallinarum TaxID=573741 RepID=A0A8J3AMB1_9BURK|nr:hypothetical protein [Oxalicibacterium faecigallinarum]GGI16420.1 hypothetical protein GCM10008066_03870 [Oxalicibacterium faecigallinarum]
MNWWSFAIAVGSMFAVSIRYTIKYPRFFQSIQNHLMITSAFIGAILLGVTIGASLVSQVCNEYLGKLVEAETIDFSIYLDISRSIRPVTDMCSLASVVFAPVMGLLLYICHWVANKRIENEEK